jgi:hypothetical protein
VDKVNQWRYCKIDQIIIEIVDSDDVDSELFIFFQTLLFLTQQMDNLGMLLPLRDVANAPIAKSKATSSGMLQ